MPQIVNAKMGDSIVTLRNGMNIRVYKFKLSTGETEILATNLFDFDTDNFAKLYALRWGIETAYFCLKQQLSVEKFSGKTPNAIRQGFWATMVMMNAITVFRHEADAEIESRQKHKNTKHQNQAKVSDLIITLRDKFILATLDKTSSFYKDEMPMLIRTIARSISPIRLCRSFERKPRPFNAVNHNLKSRL